MRSKAGEIVTDYYSDSPELNILQEDTEAREIFYRTEHLSQKVFELYSTYGWQMMIYAESAQIQVRGIEFNKSIMLSVNINYVVYVSVGRVVIILWRRVLLRMSGEIRFVKAI